MSTLKADAIEAATGTNTNLALTGTWAAKRSEIKARFPK